MDRVADTGDRTSTGEILSDALDLQPFQAKARRLAEAIAARPPGTKWFLDADTDADGLCASAVMVAALRRLGHRCLVRPSRAKDAAHYDEVFEADADAWMFLDKGMSHATAIQAQAEARGAAVAIIDHHNVPDDWTEGAHVITLNPRAEGLDGSRHASASTTAAALALAMHGEAALAWGPTGLAGAIGDWQHRPRWEGWNLALLEQVRRSGHVLARPQPRLIAVDLAAAVQREGLAADRATAEDWLRSLDIDPTSDVEDLDEDAQTRLLSAVHLQWLASGKAPGALDRFHGPVDQHVRLGTSLRHVFRLADACGRQGQAGTGIAFLLGDAAAASDAQTLFARYKQSLAHALEALAAKGPARHNGLQVAWTEEHAYTGMVAGIAMEAGIVDPSVPLCIMAPRPDGSVQVSTRGLDALVADGLDLGCAVKQAAQAVGAQGGGHPVAAGAVVPSERADDFVLALVHALQERT